MELRFLGIVALSAACVGCGTTKWSDTARTATEQLLLSDSMDRAVSRIDFRALAGKKVFVDDAPARPSTDSAYLISAVRQHLMASGGVLTEKREEANYVLEVRAGAVGTDRHDLLFGVPALSLPAVPMAGVPSQIPEIPLMKRTDQRGVAKVSLFVYNRATGRIVWQSGVVPEESRARATWIFGAGPFQQGPIYDGTKFAGSRFSIPLIDLDQNREGDNRSVSIAEEAFFVEPNEKAKEVEKPGVAQGPSGDKPASGSPPADQAAKTAAAGSPVIQAGHTAPASATGGAASSTPATPNPAPAPAAAPVAEGSAKPAAAEPKPPAGADEPPLPAKKPPDTAAPRGGFRPLPPVTDEPSGEPVRMDPLPFLRR